jgi:hypothetical protein
VSTVSEATDRCNLLHVPKVIGAGFSGLVVVVLGRMAAKGRLPRNLFAGIRIPATMRSDEAWRAGHQAAVSTLTVAGLGPFLTAVVLATKRPGPEAQKRLFRIGNAWLLGWLGLATLQANRAARAVEAS